MVARAALHSVLAPCLLAAFLFTQPSPGQVNDSQDKPFKLVVDVNKVLIPVVVWDAHGCAVDDLKREDFRVFDNEQLRLDFGFTAPKRAAASGDAGIALQSSAPHGDSSSLSPQSPLSPQRFIVFLFDDLHLDFEELAHAQKAVAKLLDEGMVRSDLAALGSTSGMAASGFSHDRAQFRDAMMRLHPRCLYRPEGAIGMTDVVSGNNPIANRPTTRAPEMTPARILAEQDLRATFDSLAQRARTMADLPGQRLMILISPGFPIPRDDMEGRSRESRIVDLAAGSNVTIDALDARGVYGTGPNLGYSQEDVMAELADGTGGAFFHNNNNLAAGFQKLTDAPKAVYLLELPLENAKHDGSYHRLKVKVDREGVEIQARRAYFAPQPARTRR